jgi:hypothetical protein
MADKHDEKQKKTPIVMKPPSDKQKGPQYANWIDALGEIVGGRSTFKDVVGYLYTNEYRLNPQLTDIQAKLSAIGRASEMTLSFQPDTQKALVEALQPGKPLYKAISVDTNKAADGWNHKQAFATLINGAK